MLPPDEPRYAGERLPSAAANGEATMGRRSVGIPVFAVVAGVASLALALNPQPLPPGFYFSFRLNGAQIELRQGAVGGSSSPTIHTDFSYRVFYPPDPIFPRDDDPTRGSFEVSAPNVDLARAAGLAAAVAGSACIDQATLSAALAGVGATLLSYEPPDPCLRASGGNPVDVAIALEAAAGALGAGGDVLPIFDELVGALLPMPSGCPLPTAR